METITLRIGSQSFALALGSRIQRLEKRVAAAMRRGGGTVRFPLAGGGEVDAVLTPGLAVSIERRKHPYLPPRPGDEAEPAIDWPDMDQ